MVGSGIAGSARRSTTGTTGGRFELQRPLLATPLLATPLQERHEEAGVFRASVRNGHRISKFQLIAMPRSAACT